MKILINDQKSVSKFKSKKWPQYYAALAAQVGGIALGASWFWTATAIPDMVKIGEFGEITNSDRSWINSIPQLGGLLVCPLTGYCMSRYGRKTAMQWYAIPFAGGWILIALAPSIPWLIFGRFIQGAGAGFYSQIVMVFIAETAEAAERGTLMCVVDVMICVGTLFVYVTGTLFSWRDQALICSIIPVVNYLLLMFVPESPYYLMEQNLELDASKALCWLRGATSADQVEIELLAISDCTRQKASGCEEVGWRVLKDWSILKPILLCMGLMTCFQGSFIKAILSDVVEIFKKAGTVDEYESTILLGVTQLMAALLPMIIADRCGRRKLLLISFVMIVISLTTLGAFFRFKDRYGDEAVKEAAWVPLCSLLVYVIALGIGVVPITFVLTGELLPSKAKGLAASLMNIIFGIENFVVLYIFWDMLDVLGQDGTYWVIASIAVAASVFNWCCVPETKGKTLLEIQGYFSDKRKT